MEYFHTQSGEKIVIERENRKMEDGTILRCPSGNGRYLGVRTWRVGDHDTRFIRRQVTFNMSESLRQHHRVLLDFVPLNKIYNPYRRKSFTGYIRTFLYIRRWQTTSQDINSQSKTTNCYNKSRRYKKV